MGTALFRFVGSQCFAQSKDTITEPRTIARSSVFVAQPLYEPRCYLQSSYAGMLHAAPPWILDQNGTFSSAHPLYESSFSHPTPRISPVGKSSVAKPMDLAYAAQTISTTPTCAPSPYEHITSNITQTRTQPIFQARQKLQISTHLMKPSFLPLPSD